MEEFRRLPAQKRVEKELSRRGTQKIRPPDHLRDAHGGVVHHHGQLIGEKPVGAPQQKVPAVRGQILRELPQVTVGEGDRLLRHPEPRGAPPARRLPPGDLLRRQAPAGAGIDREPVLPVGS